MACEPTHTTKGTDGRRGRRSTVREDPLLSPGTEGRPRATRLRHARRSKSREKARRWSQGQGEGREAGAGRARCPSWAGKAEEGAGGGYWFLSFPGEIRASENSYFCQAARQLASVPSSQLCVKLASGGDPTYAFNIRFTGEEVHGTSKWRPPPGSAASSRWRLC